MSSSGVEKTGDPYMQYINVFILYDLQNEKNIRIFSEWLDVDISDEDRKYF